MRITVIGDLLYDHFIWMERLPRMGETVTGYRSEFLASGKGGNQAVQAARLGAETYMIGKVGCDRMGDVLLDMLTLQGVQTDFVFRDPNEETGTDCVLVDAEGNNSIVVAPSANSHITVEDVRSARAVIESSDVLLSQLQINEEAITEALTIARAAGVTTVLNPAPARAIPDGYYGLVDYFTPNETEAEFFAGCYRAEHAPDRWQQLVTQALRQKGVRNVIVTLGSEGSLYCGEAGTFAVPAYPVQAVDTTAAGDSFNAALCVRLAQGASVREAMQYANAAGGLTASARGSIPSLPDDKEIRHLMGGN